MKNGFMKKKTIGIVLAAMLSLGALTAVAAEAAEHHGHGRHGRGGMFMSKDMESRLNLTADQKAKLEQMHQEQREQMKNQFAEGPGLHPTTSVAFSFTSAVGSTASLDCQSTASLAHWARADYGMNKLASLQRTRNTQAPTATLEHPIHEEGTSERKLRQKMRVY